MRLLSPIKSFSRHFTYNYDEGGVRQIVTKIVWRVRQWVSSDSHWLIYRQSLAGFDTMPRLPLQVRELDFESLLNLGYFKALAFPEGVRGKIQSGARCHGCLLDGHLANVGWTSMHCLELEAGVRVEEQHAIAISDCFTIPEFRSKGIYADSLIRMLRYGRQAGCSHALIGVDPVNIPSIRAIEKVGFAPHYRLTVVRRFGYRMYRKSPFSAQCAGTGSARSEIGSP